MSIRHLQLLRNIGQFDFVAAGAQLHLTKLTLIYAENGRGKTTLAAVMRSAGTDDPQLVIERQRLGSANPPHIVIGRAAGPIVFENGTWSMSLPEVAVFDDAFVAANVCSGIEIDAVHRQNLHELILGAQGVALNAALQNQVARIEQHNQALRQHEGAIPAAARGALTVDTFCALRPVADIDAAIAVAERNLAAARSADGIRQQASFAPVSLPAFDPEALRVILARALPDLEVEAGSRVREHLRSLGRDGEAWVGDGMGRIAGASAGHDHSVCPFCAQDLEGSSLIRHYQVYFSEAYEALKAAITEVGQGINRTHGGDVPAAFERSMRVATEGREFWHAFIEVSQLNVDTAAIARNWNAAREAVLTVLRAKAASPLDAMALSRETLAAIDAYNAWRDVIARLSARLQRHNADIAVVKEQAAAANVAAVEADLELLQAVRARYTEPSATACQVYLDEKAAKSVTEGLRGQARDALDNYRQNIFPAYETVINDYLRRFNAGFRLGEVGSVNN